MIRLHKKRETSKSATRTVSAKAGSTAYQVFLRSVTDVNEPSNELLKATTGDEMVWRGEVWCRYHLYRREGICSRKTQNRHFSNISRTEDALCQIFMNPVQAHISYNNLAATPTFKPFTSHTLFYAYFCVVLTYYLMFRESKCLIVLIPLSIVSILYWWCYLSGLLCK